MTEDSHQDWVACGEKLMFLQKWKEGGGMIKHLEIDSSPGAAGLSGERQPGTFTTQGISLKHSYPLHRRPPLRARADRKGRQGACKAATTKGSQKIAKGMRTVLRERELWR